MTTDIADVHEAVQAYLDALHDGNADALARIFAPGSALHASAEGKAASLPLDPWLERVRGRTSARDSGHAPENRIHSIEVVDDMAMAKVSSAFRPKRFTDFLSLVRTDDGWRIVAKTYQACDIG